MDATEILNDAFTRVRQTVDRALADIDEDALVWQPEPAANPIGWLVWHLTRIQDDHVAELDDGEQIWTRERLAPQFGLEAAALDTGYGHSAEQVRALRPSSVEVLGGYHTLVADRTGQFLSSVSTDDLDRVVDTSYDPPVTMGVRLVSVISDNLQHAGQAVYLRGVYDRSATA